MEEDHVVLTTTGMAMNVKVIVYVYEIKLKL